MHVMVEVVFLERVYYQGHMQEGNGVTWSHPYFFFKNLSIEFVKYF